MQEMVKIKNTHILFFKFPAAPNLMVHCHLLDLCELWLNNDILNFIQD